MIWSYNELPIFQIPLYYLLLCIGYILQVSSFFGCKAFANALIRYYLKRGHFPISTSIGWKCYENNIFEQIKKGYLSRSSSYKFGFRTSSIKALLIFNKCYRYKTTAIFIAELNINKTLVFVIRALNFATYIEYDKTLHKTGAD